MLAASGQGGSYGRSLTSGRGPKACSGHPDGDRPQAVRGTPEELPRINHRKEYEQGPERPPDYRLTCFFIDRRYRRQGVSAVALRGALDLIAQAGGGVAEAYPQYTAGKQITASFLYNGTRSLFEQAGFAYSRPKGKNHCVMSTTVAPAG